MTASKRKGTAAESAVVAWLQANGHPNAERRALAGVNDKGDIAGVPGVCIEVKNHQAFDLAGWVGELEAEIVNSKARTGVVIAKRRGKGNVAEWYAVLPAHRWLALINEGNNQ